MDAWNLSVQRQLTQSVSATLAYVGNKGTHTFAGDGQTLNLNAVAACIPANESITGQGLCWNPAAPAGSLTETSNTNYLRKYYSQFGWTQNLTYYHDGFDSHYNALQATLDKRFSEGLQFTARYTWQAAFNYGNNDYALIDRRWFYGRNDDLRQQEIQSMGTTICLSAVTRGFSAELRSGRIPDQRIPAKPVFGLVERSALHSELWRVRIRHTERPLHAQ